MNKIRAYILSTLLVFAAVTTATEVPVDTFETLEAIDTIAQGEISAQDSVWEIPDPEWYVAPTIVQAPLRAPKRMSAASCDIDSIQTYNVDSVLTSVAVYEYGDTTRTMTWSIQSDGSRIGTSREESGTNGNITFTATYAWDAVTGTWKGTNKDEHYYPYPGSKDTARIIYDWQNGAWSPKTKYTYTYDGANRELEFTTYERNAAGQLAYSKQRIREYNAAGTTTLDIQYTAHNGTDWSAGTKELWVYNGPSNKQTLHEKYSLTNGDWSITLREIKGYDAAGNNDLIENYALQSNVWKGTKKEEYVFFSASKKTSSIVYTWSNGNWVYSTKEIWEFNGPSAKQTLHEKYSWSNGDWQITLQENTGFTGTNNTSVENYTYTNGVQKGTKKEEYTFIGTTKTATITYKWTNNAWVKNVWTVSDKVSTPNESCKYNWNATAEAWVGTGNRTLTTNNSSKKPIEVITQVWPANATDWVNYSKKTTVYSGANTTQEATFTWSEEANDWVGTSRSDWHYNAQGKNDTIKTYTNNGAEWIYSNRTVKNYNAAGTEIMVHNAQWDGEKWVMTSMTRTDIVDVTIDGVRQVLNASWSCTSDSVWKGIQKDTAAYTASGKMLYSARFTSWANDDWVPSYQVGYVYDEAERILDNQRWDWKNNSWQGTTWYTYAYNAQGLEVSSSYYGSWNSTNGWIGTSKKETTYDDAGNIIAMTRYGWNYSNNTWKESNQYLYQYDAAGNTTEQVVQNYANNTWTNSIRYEKEYKGSILIKDNDYEWINDTWRFTRRNETYYDNDSQAKLRREINGYWSNGVVSSFTDNHYFYACDPKYTIRFVNYDGTALTEDQVLLEGAMPVVPADPTKPADAQYTYTFAGWDKPIVPVVGDETYTATFSSTINKYTITFKNGIDTLQSTEVEYGATPTAPANPTKDATAQYTYTFKAWNPAITAVTSEAIYTAEFDSTTNKYTIVFKNGTDTLQSTEVEYGVMPTYNGATPTKPSDAQYTYAFAGWDAEIVAVTGEATYNATFSNTTNTYLVTFKNGIDTLQSIEVEYGVMPTYSGATPTKPSDVQYTYTFAGWDAEIVAVTGEATYNATFSNTTNTYTITFKNGTDTLQSTEVEYGVMPTYNGATPTKPSDAQYTYTFAGWDAEIVAVTGEATYNATFSNTTNTYLITFKNGTDTLQSIEVEYGVMPTYSGATPTKPSDAQYTYTFAGWDVEPVMVVGEATYNATFSNTTNTYLVTFKNGTDTLQSTEVEYGVMPTYNGATPTKPSDAQYTYTFAGWDAEIVAVTGEATYNATFSNTTNTYLITFKNGTDTLQSTEIEYGIVPTYNGATPTKPSVAQYTYTFAGWDAEIVAVVGEATYNATFSNTTNTYLITFKNGIDTLQSTEVEYGVMPTYNGVPPTKPSDAQYTYTFAGWDVEPVTVVGEATYNATFSNTTNKYTITFKNGTDTLQSTEVEYGVMPTYSGATPTKPSDVQYTYAFAGWDAEPVAVVGEATYNATFSNTTNTYLITFKNGTDTLQSTEVEYGVMPTYNGATPTKPSDAQYTYAFAGWDAEIVAVTGEATYNATFSNTTNTYLVTFKNGTDTLQSTKVEYGIVPTYNGSTPTKPSDVQYTYAFAGWDAEIVAVTGKATYNATFSSTQNSYTITWLNADGTLIEETIVEAGNAPAHANINKESTDQYSFTFKGWTPAIVPASGNATYTAVFDTVVNKYTVTFYYEDGITVIDRMEVAYGETPITHYTPAKAQDDQYYYTFSGWTPEIVPVTGDAAYMATYDQVTREYEITFKNYNGRTLQTLNVAYGEVPEYTGDTPQRPETRQYRYEFTGWTPELTEVTGNATYTAVYTAIDKSQGLEDVQGNNVQCTKIIHDNQIFILRGGKTYTLQGVEVEE